MYASGEGHRPPSSVPAKVQLWRSTAAQRALGGVVHHAQAAILKDAGEAAPAVEAVSNSFGGLAVGGQFRLVRLQSKLQFGHERPAELGTR